MQRVYLGKPIMAFPRTTGTTWARSTERLSEDTDGRVEPSRLTAIPEDETKIRRQMLAVTGPFQCIDDAS
jgi:hypothetical protein